MVVVLIPAYNVEKNLDDVISRIPKIVRKIIVLDDGSTDNTALVAQKWDNVELIQHEKNQGYGATQKTLIKEFLKGDSKICVFIHGDGGHNPKEIPLLIAPLLKRKYKVSNGSRARKIIIESESLFGSKFLGAWFNGPMPPYKFFGNRVLSILQKIICGANVDDFHSGFRACTSDVLNKITFDNLHDGYRFDAEFLLEVCKANYEVANIPVSAIYDPEVRSALDPISYGAAMILFIFRHNRFTE